MYDPITGNLDNRPARVPDALERSCVADMVLGQYALVDVDAIWVDEEGFATINKRCDLDDEESAEREFDYVALVQLEQGLVVDAMGMADEPEVRFVRTPKTKAAEDESFRAEDMLPIVWIVANAVEAAVLKRLYKEQTGQDLYLPSPAHRPERRTEEEAQSVRKRRFGYRFREMQFRLIRTGREKKQSAQEDL